MSQAAISESAPGLLRLVGVIDYVSGPALREQGAKLIGASQAQSLVLDCAGVEKSSSVGLALLLAWLRDARKAGCSLQIQALPADLKQIAQVSGALELLPLAA